MQRLTEPQKQLYDYLRTFPVDRRKSSYSEIVKDMGIVSRSSLHAQMIALKNAGYIDWIVGKQRSWWVIKGKTDEEKWIEHGRRLQLKENIKEFGKKRSYKMAMQDQLNKLRMMNLREEIGK